MSRVLNGLFPVWTLSCLLNLAGCGQNEVQITHEPQDAVPSLTDSRNVQATQSLELFPQAEMTDLEVRKKIEQSQLLLGQRDFEGAFEEINVALNSARNNDFAEALGLRSLIYFGRDDVPAAVSDLNLAILVCDESLRARFISMRGTFLTAASTFDENPFLLLLARTDHRKSPVVNHSIAQNLTAAIKAMTVDELADSFSIINKTALEENDVEEGLPLNSNVRTGFQNLLNEEFQLAHKNFTEELSLHPGDVMALVGRAVATSCSSKDYRSIHEDLRQAVEFETDLTVADDLLLYHQFLPTTQPRPLPPSQNHRQKAIQSLAQEHGFPLSAAETLGVHIESVTSKWGTLNKQQRVGQIFAGIAHQDLSQDGKLLMPLLVELREAEPRLRVRQRLSFIISEIAAIGVRDPRAVPDYASFSTPELLELTKALRWDRNLNELQAIGKVIGKRSQDEINSAVKAWEANALELNPALSSGPALHRHLTLEQVVVELGPATVIPLNTMLMNPEVAHVRRAIVDILKVHGDRKSIEPLKAAIADGLGSDDFREQAAVLLGSLKESVPALPIDPNVIRTIKKIVVSDPYAHNYLDFRGYEEGLIAAGESVVDPLTQGILSMLVQTKDIGIRVHDIGGTPARILLELGKQDAARRKVLESIDSMLDALQSGNDKVALETKWYVVCVLAEMSDSLQKHPHPLRPDLGQRADVLSLSVSHLGARTAQTDSVYRHIQMLKTVWETWKPTDDPFR